MIPSPSGVARVEQSGVVTLPSDTMVPSKVVTLAPVGLVLLGHALGWLQMWPHRFKAGMEEESHPNPVWGCAGGSLSSPGAGSHWSRRSWTHPDPHEICDPLGPRHGVGRSGESVCSPQWDPDPLSPQFGAIRVRCLFTPCHTSGHMCYFMWEDDSLDAPALFSGIPPWGHRHTPCVLPVPHTQHSWGHPSTPWYPPPWPWGPSMPSPLSHR